MIRHTKCSSFGWTFEVALIARQCDLIRISSCTDSRTRGGARDSMQEPALLPRLDMPAVFG